MKATKKRSMGQAKWSKNEQESNIDAKKSYQPLYFEKPSSNNPIVFGLFQLSE